MALHTANTFAEDCQKLLPALTLKSGEQVHVRVTGYEPLREEDVTTLQLAADNKNVAKTLRGIFPQPYTLECARFWVAHNAAKPLVSGEQQQQQLLREFPATVPIVAVKPPAAETGRRDA